MLLNGALEERNESLEVVDCKVEVAFHTLFFLHLVYNGFEGVDFSL